MTVSFNQSTYIVNENERLVQALLVLNKSIASNVTVEVITNDNTTIGEHIEPINNVLHISNDITGGVDYSSGPYNVTFPAGVTSVLLNITINNDTVLEYNETFNLIITEESLPKYVILGEINITEVTIMNGGDSGEYFNC